MGKFGVPRDPGDTELQPSNMHLDLDSDPTDRLSRQTAFTWKQSIFAHRIPRRFKKCGRIWTLVRGSITWFLWRERNEIIFSEQTANSHRVCNQVWTNLIDYGRIAWANTLKKCQATRGNKKQKIIREFRNIWCRGEILATWADNQPSWHVVMPT